MESTVNLQLPYIMPSQAQKHVTHNEALAMLDAMVQLCVRDRDMGMPPPDPQAGDRYIVASGAGGAWMGWDDAIALWIDGGWRRIDPRQGWLAWVDDEETLVRWTGADWSTLGSALTALQNLTRLGIGTLADAGNPFAAKLNKALWTARYAGDGGDGNLRYTLNKEGAAGVLSLLMQSGWSGRAEIGLIGNDDLAVKVSPDGSDWKEAIRIDRANGRARFPNTPVLTALSELAGSNGAFVRFTGAGAAAMQPMLGAVSQSGGAATGAIVERGSNANGYYERYASGLVVCLMTITFDSTSGNTQDYTLPASLMANSIGSACTQPSLNNGATIAQWRAASPVVLWSGNPVTTIGLRGTGTGTDNAVGIRVAVMGRWF